MSGQYPKTLALDDFDDFGVTSHQLTAVDAHFGAISFDVGSGGSGGFVANADHERYIEFQSVTPSFNLFTSIGDARSTSPFRCSSIVTDPGTPSAPADSLFLQEECGDNDDDPIIDVVLDQAILDIPPPEPEP